MSLLIHFNFPTALNIPSTLASAHAVFKRTVPVVQGLIIKLGELLTQPTPVANAQLTQTLNILICTLIRERLMLMRRLHPSWGISVSLSPKPIKADIMRRHVCEENTNRGASPFMPMRRANIWHLVRNCRKHEHFQGKSIKFSQSIMNSAGDYFGMWLSCREYQSDSSLICSACTATIWLARSEGNSLDVSQAA